MCATIVLILLYIILKVMMTFCKDLGAWRINDWCIALNELSIVKGYYKNYALCKY